MGAEAGFRVLGLLLMGLSADEYRNIIRGPFEKRLILVITVAFRSKNPTFDLSGFQRRSRVWAFNRWVLAHRLGAEMDCSLIFVLAWLGGRVCGSFYRLDVQDAKADR